MASDNNSIIECIFCCFSYYGSGLACPMSKHLRFPLFHVMICISNKENGVMHHFYAWTNGKLTYKRCFTASMVRDPTKNVTEWTDERMVMTFYGDA